jgi:hypothetical protein
MLDVGCWMLDIVSNRTFLILQAADLSAFDGEAVELE